MSSYIRPDQPGATVFFTACLADRGSDLLVREIAALRAAVRTTRAERPFGIEAWVVLPDHMHCVWRLPDGDSDFSTRMGAIKARFSMAVRRAGFTPPPPNERRAGFTPPPPKDRRAGFTPPLPGDHGRQFPVGGEKSGGVNPALRRGQVGIWQKRFWEHHIRDEVDFLAHVRYCWVNPVKHGLVSEPGDWPYSSYHRDGGAGLA